MSDAAKVALAALNAGAEWDRDTIVPGAAARALRDHVASLEVSRLLDVNDIKHLCDIANELHVLADRGVPGLRSYLRAHFGSRAIDQTQAIASKIRMAQARAGGE